MCTATHWPYPEGGGGWCIPEEFFGGKNLNKKNWIEKKFELKKNWIKKIWINPSPLKKWRPPPPK